MRIINTEFIIVNHTFTYGGILRLVVKLATGEFKVFTIRSDKSLTVKDVASGYTEFKSIKARATLEVYGDSIKVRACSCVKFIEDKVFLDFTANNTVAEIVGYTERCYTEICAPNEEEHELKDVVLFVKSKGKLYSHSFTLRTSCDYYCCEDVYYDVEEIDNTPSEMVEVSCSTTVDKDNQLGFLVSFDNNILYSGDTVILEYSEDGGDCYYPHGYVNLVI